MISDSHTWPHLHIMVKPNYLRFIGLGVEAMISFKELPGRLVFPESPEYDAARRVYNLRFSNAEFPVVIDFVQNTNDVVNALKWALMHDLAFRVRGGRHSLEGFSLIDGGLVIDVSDMKRVHIDREEKTATVQGGINQEEIVRELWKYGFAVPTGTAATPGVAGVTLGGGVGLLTRARSLTSDSLIRLEMVVASGKQSAEVITADECQNSDLFWACRGGGGGNFGIATSMTFKIFPIADVAIYQIDWDWDELEAVFEVWQEWAPCTDERLGSALSLRSREAGFVRSYGIFLGPEKELQHLLQPLLNVGSPRTLIRTVPYLEAFEFFNDNVTPVKTKWSSSWAYQAFSTQTLSTIRDFLAKAPAVDDNMYCLAWGGVVSRIAPEDTAFWYRKPRFFLNWKSFWDSSTNAAESVAWVERLRDMLHPHITGAYVNIPDSDIEDWPRAYYGGNYPRLQAVKCAYDPKNIFQFGQSIFPECPDQCPD